ncbi:MAG TPA: PAS domain S-box protein, partial [Puia sp.]|nr:PAS domain S-box protein [Puia sp.]
RMEYASISFNPMFNERGELFGTACYSKDITAETNSREALEKTKTELQTIMDSSLDMICSIDADGIILSMSAACKTILGYTPDELIGKQLFDFLCPEDKEATEEMADRIMKGLDMTHFENRYVRKDGSLVPLLWSARWDPQKRIRYGVARDATEKKKSEADLLESEKKYRYLFKNNPLPILMWDFETLKIVDCNHEAMNIYGYTREEFLQLTTRQLRPDEDVSLLEDVVKAPESYGEPHHRTWRHKKKNGEIMYVEVTGHLMNYNGRKVSLALSIDVTDRKKTAQALEAAYSEKNTILESIGDAFFAVDKNWTVNYWNNHAEKVLMVARNEIVGKNLWDVFSGSIGSESYKRYHEALETNEIIHFEDYYETLNTWYEISAYPSRNGLSVYFKDITERKLIEHRLRAERNLLRTLIDNLPHSVYFKDKYARKLISNKVDYELLGFKTEDEVLGKNDLDLLPPEIASLAFEQDNIILKSGKPLIDYEHYYTPANGTWISMLTSKIPLFDEKNETIGLLGIGRDTTEQKLAEKKLKELNAELEKNIQQLTISNAELEQFAYVASHDLQEPLRMVISFMTLLEKKYGHVVDDKGRQYIHFAVDGAQRMRQIILDLLDFSRIGRTEDDAEQLDFNKLLNEILALYRRQLEELQGKIRFENLPTLHTYKTPLRQVFQNLVGNGLKYQRKDVAPVIDISCKETKTYYQFSVKDNGIGIAPQYFDKIFIIFQRLHNRDEYPGTGMGLAITKKIVESMGGKIWLESEEGKGSTFHFTLLKINRL